MTVSKKINIIDNKIEENKTRQNLDRQTAKIWALSSGNNNKYEFLKGAAVLTETELLEKAAIIKRFEYLPLDSELKNKLTLQKIWWRWNNCELKLMKNQELKHVIHRIWIFERWWCFTRERTLRKICYNPKIWILNFSQWVKEQTDIAEKQYNLQLKNIIVKSNVQSWFYLLRI